MTFSRVMPGMRTIHPSRIRAVGIRYSSGAGPVYSPPTGYLFNEKPARKGKKRRREDWEIPMWIYFGISGFATLLYITRPSMTMEDWALHQAKLRMAEDGIDLSYKVD